MAETSCFPRNPIDDAEREACSVQRANGARACAEVGKETDDGQWEFICTRLQHHDGDHVSSDGRVVNCRWPQRGSGEGAPAASQKMRPSARYRQTKE